ncbi:hypothetical protein HYS50_00265 [Candidatus Woesearchaeota archaeon]|nr:hypothetical protein [Candidatus Woesearchaeota archaeon]
MEADPAYLDAIVFVLSDPRHRPPLHREPLELFVSNYLSEVARKREAKMRFNQKMYTCVLNYLSITGKIQQEPAQCYRLSREGAKQYKKRIQRLQERG